MFEIWLKPRYDDHYTSGIDGAVPVAAHLNSFHDSSVSPSRAVKTCLSGEVVDVLRHLLNLSVEVLLDLLNEASVLG